MLVTLDRGDYWQCAFVIRKDGFAAVRARGLDKFREDIVAIAPFLRDRVEELRDWDDVKLLTVTVDRLERWWRPGLLCIGDSAHAMSPIGGVGINLAVQDAVAAANILAVPLRDGGLTDAHLAAVQRRRTLPTRLTQAMQVAIQQRVIDPVLRSDAPLTAPWPVRLFNRAPLLARIPARLIGMGSVPSTSTARRSALLQLWRACEGCQGRLQLGEERYLPERFSFLRHSIAGKREARYSRIIGRLWENDQPWPTSFRVTFWSFHLARKYQYP